MAEYSCKIPRIVIAGTQSGVGKTTIVTGLLAALKKRGCQLQSYKVGPDYIDPGYHQLAGGKPSHNLDTWLVPPECLATIFSRTASGNDLAIIEGVMGLYDGGRHGISSTAAVAKLLKAPVVLVIDARSMGESAAAIVLGFKKYDPEVCLAGVIINRLGSATHRQMVKEAVERLGVPVLGTVFRDEALTMPERHLGLKPVTENQAEETIAAMARRMEEGIEIDKLLAAAQAAPELRYLTTGTEKPGDDPVRIGVARDEVFSFYYPESLQALATAGAQIIEFSPLQDAAMPEVDGLILGGGFPEMFVRQLSENMAMRRQISAACRDGMPVYAECGGLMYLCSQIKDFTGESYEMAGVVPAVSEMQSKLQTVGYVEVTALRDTVLCGAGDKMRGHEFHFSNMTPLAPDAFPWAFEFEKMRNGQKHLGGFCYKNTLASYLHMHFAGNLPAARRFTAKCREYREQRKQGDR